MDIWEFLDLGYYEQHYYECSWICVLVKLIMQFFWVNTYGTNSYVIGYLHVPF